MTCDNDILRKVIPIIAILLLSSCATTLQIQQVSEGQFIDMGAYSIKTPPGEGWKAEVVEQKAAVRFYRQSLQKGVIAGTTIIQVFQNVIFPGGWHLSEEEAADDYRNNEERGMVELGVKKGQYQLSDVKKGITAIDGRKLYFMSYKTAELKGLFKTAEAVLYLFFPPDFKKMHIFYCFLINEAYVTGKYEVNLTQINPVINSFLIVSPLASLTGINGELIRAATDGNISAVRDLIDKRADVNAGSRHGSALMLAAFYGHTEVVKLLIDRGADVNGRADKSNNTALMGAILGGEPEIAKLLIQKGAAVNARNKQGSSALIIAAGLGNIEIVKILIANGADINAKREDGTTALKVAAQWKRPEMVKLLKEAGAKE